MRISVLVYDDTHLLPVRFITAISLAAVLWREKKKYYSGKFRATVFVFVWVVHVECVETVIWCLQH